MNDHILLTVRETAELLRVSRPQIYLLAKRGAIPVVRRAGAVRIHREQLLKQLAEDAQAGLAK